MFTFLKIIETGGRKIYQHKETTVIYRFVHDRYITTTKNYFSYFSSFSSSLVTTTLNGFFPSHLIQALIVCCVVDLIL